MVILEDTRKDAHNSVSLEITDAPLLNVYVRFIEQYDRSPKASNVQSFLELLVEDRRIMVEFPSRDLTG